MRLPRKNLLKWISKNYGIGGFENYNNEQVYNVLKGLNLILSTGGKAEIAFIGKLLLKLSESPSLIDVLLDEIEMYK